MFALNRPDAERTQSCRYERPVGACRRTLGMSFCAQTGRARSAVRLAGSRRTLPTSTT